MFCTNLRRRGSFASVLPKLNDLRENDLGTHDVALYIGPKTGQSTRQLRILLLSPSTARDGNLETTMERIRHLCHLTGGQDIAVIFLISPPIDTRFASARTLDKPPEDHGTDGMLAYCKLQAALTSQPDLAWSVPILPLSTLEGLPALLKSHLAAVSGPKKVQPPAATPFELLQLCSSVPPLRQDTAFLLSDLFGNLRELAGGCCEILNSAQQSSSSPSSEGPITGSEFGGDARESLEMLKDLVEHKEWENMVLLWREEWTMP